LPTGPGYRRRAATVLAHHEVVDDEDASNGTKIDPISSRKFS